MPIMHHSHGLSVSRLLCIRVQYIYLLRNALLAFSSGEAEQESRGRAAAREAPDERVYGVGAQRESATSKGEARHSQLSHFHATRCAPVKLLQIFVSYFDNYILYLYAVITSTSCLLEIFHASIFGFAGKKWKEMSREEKEPYYEEYFRHYDQFVKQHPNYRYRQLRRTKFSSIKPPSFELRRSKTTQVSHQFAGANTARKLLKMPPRTGGSFEATTTAPLVNIAASLYNKSTCPSASSPSASPLPTTCRQASTTMTASQNGANCFESTPVSTWTSVLYCAVQ